MKVKYTDESYKVSGRYTSWSVTKDYYQGDTQTEFGVVRIYCQWRLPGYPKMANRTQLSFIWKGRHFYRTINKAYTKLGLARLAGKFAADVAWGKVV